MRRGSWLGALLGVLAVHGVPSHALAQDEPEIMVTEPPGETEPPALEPALEEATLSEEPRAESPSEPDVPKKPPLGHLRVGGGIGFGLAADRLSFGIAPQVSYLFKRIVEPGVSVRYEYTKDRRFIPDVIWHTYGASLFTRLYPIQQLFFLVEGEIINTGSKAGGIRSDRRNYGNLLLGAGFIIGVGKGVFFGTSIKFAVFRNPFYPNVFPIISVGGGYAF